MAVRFCFLSPLFNKECRDVKDGTAMTAEYNDDRIMPRKS